MCWAYDGGLRGIIVYPDQPRSWGNTINEYYNRRLPNLEMVVKSDRTVEQHNQGMTTVRPFCEDLEVPPEGFYTYVADALAGEPETTILRQRVLDWSDEDLKSKTMFRLDMAPSKGDVMFEKGKILLRSPENGV
jgi:hypothetical protein